MLCLDEKTNIIFIHCHPRRLEILEEDCTEREIELSSLAIPVFPLCYGPTSGHRIQLFPIEKKQEACGISLLPILFVPGTAQPMLPSLQHLKNEVFSLQRTSPIPAHCKNAGKVHAMCQQDYEWRHAARELEIYWPEPIPQIETGENNFLAI